VVSNRRKEYLLKESDSRTRVIWGGVIIPTAVIPTAVIPTFIIPTIIIPTAVIPTVNIPTVIIPTAITRLLFVYYRDMP
jgi:hypothetical protein